MKTLVSAPAGSGKTTRLVREYLAMLRRFDADRIVAITFTRRAAAELVDRVSRVLRAIAGIEVMRETELAIYRDVAPSEQARIHDALAKLASAPIGTVDAFVHALLREHVLHAFLPVPDGGRAWLDGVEFGGDRHEVWRLAAREVLDDGSPDAALVLSHATVGRACDGIALLARQGTPQRVSAQSFFEAFARQLRRHIRDAPEIWRDLDDGVVGAAAREHHPAVAAWLADGRRRCPEALLPWCCALSNRAASAERRAARDEALAAACEELGLPRATTLEVDARWGVAGAYLSADGLADAYVALAARARSGALRVLGSSGQLGYDEMLLAATSTCRAAPPSLRDRYDALLVDEVQDTSPAQLAFYRAFAAMRDGDEAPLARFFVGDVRQSVYRFRGADPHGWSALEREIGGAPEALDTNRRSVEELVSVQREAFDALHARSWGGVAILGELEASRGSSGASDSAVHVIDAAKDEDADVLAVAHFAARLRERWAAPGCDRERAAVLASSWRLARNAVAALRATGVRAQLTGDKALLGSRVATDVRLFLAALLDPSDDVAMLGVLKHPSIGVSDAEILALRHDRSLGLSCVFRPDAGERVPASLARVAPILRQARAAIGRAPTSDVLERLIAKLHWRPLLALGPEGGDGEAIAQLEIVLEWTRQVEEGVGADPFRVLESLVVDELRPDDLPPVRLQPGTQVVEVTTIHGSKGLEWEHVAIVGIDARTSGAVRSGGPVRILSHRDRTFVGVALDPAGGVTEVADPIAKVLSAVDSEESRAEIERLFYVAFTRARETVTFGIPFGENGWKGALRDVFIRHAGLDESVSAIRVVESGMVTFPSASTELRDPTLRSAPFTANWVDAHGWSIVQPSALGDVLSSEERGAVRNALRMAARFVQGKAAPEIPPLLAGVEERTIGQLVHGWLERWKFEGQPSISQAVDYVASRWGVRDDRREPLARWLAETGLVLRDTLPEFAELLRGATLHFEQPVMGVEGDRILNGRTDLVVEREGSLIILDFKAGRKFATSVDSVPGFDDYALQLDAYRRVYAASGKRVAELGLVYVRGVSWVRFHGIAGEAQ